MTQPKKNARPNAATLGQAAEVVIGTQLSIPNFNTYAEMRQDFTAEPVASLLSCGAENGILMGDLARIYGRGRRELRHEIHRERKRGIPICSDNLHGYFLPATEEERSHCIASLRSRAHEILAAADGIEKGGDVDG